MCLSNPLLQDGIWEEERQEKVGGRLANIGER